MQTAEPITGFANVSARGVSELTSAEATDVPPLRSSRRAATDELLLSVCDANEAFSQLLDSQSLQQRPHRIHVNFELEFLEALREFKFLQSVR